MVLPTTALILVAVMNNRRDLEIARLLGWYRIPLRSAPKVIAVDYLAFYQTGSFGDQKWRIQYVAPVQGHELTTRLELLKEDKDHPHASEEYFKIQVGPLIKLPHPIHAKTWRRITFFYTTGEHLLQAQTVSDLVVQDDERRILWQALRDRAVQDQSYSTDVASDKDSDLDPKLLAALLGIQGLLDNKDG
jgi:hypothetical protein